MWESDFVCANLLCIDDDDDDVCIKKMINFNWFLLDSVHHQFAQQLITRDRAGWCYWGSVSSKLLWSHTVIHYPMLLTLINCRIVMCHRVHLCIHLCWSHRSLNQPAHSTAEVEFIWRDWVNSNRRAQFASNFQLCSFLHRKYGAAYWYCAHAWSAKQRGKKWPQNKCLLSDLAFWKLSYLAPTVRAAIICRSA